jgi:hypothetical protein
LLSLALDDPCCWSSECRWDVTWLFAAEVGAVAVPAVTADWTTGWGDDAAADPNTPDPAPSAKIAELTPMVIAAAVAIAVFRSIACSLVRIPLGTTQSICPMRQPDADEGRRRARMKLV